MPYEDDAAKTMSAYDMVLIVATSEFEGRYYAEELGLKGFRVITDKNYAQGSRCKGLVITPGYINQELSRLLAGTGDAFDAMAAALRGAILTSAPLG